MECYIDVESGAVFIVTASHKGRKHTVHDGWSNERNDGKPYADFGARKSVHGTNLLRQYYRVIRHSAALNLAPIAYRHAANDC